MKASKASMEAATLCFTGASKQHVDTCMEDMEASVGSGAIFHGCRGNIQFIWLWKAP